VGEREAARGDPSGQRSDEALMAAYVQGDEAAFRALFERYAPQLVRLLRVGNLGEEAARDLTQQTFVQLHRARRDFRQGSALRPWLLTIAFNLKRDHLRAQRRRPEVLSDEVEQAVEHHPANGLQRQADRARVRRAVARLPEAQREVVELHWFQELPFPQVAEILGIRVSTAKVRAHRGYKRLRALLCNRDAGSDIPSDEAKP
jgi:RNA polymerase sigma-70 factor (ECF subfamily)